MTQVKRIDSERISIVFDNAKEATLFANDSVYIDRHSIANAENFSKIYDSLFTRGR